MTCDMFGGVKILSKFVCDLWYYEDLEEKAHWLRELISHKAVYRTAPATPGLLNTYIPNTVNPKQEELESWKGLVTPRDYGFFLSDNIVTNKIFKFFLWPQHSVLLLHIHQPLSSYN